MANAVYPKAREGFAGGDVAWDTDTIKLVALRAGYVYDAAHQFLSEIDVAEQVAISTAFTNKTITDGVLDADNVVLTAIPYNGGDVISSIVIFQDTGVPSTSRLLMFYDTKADTTAISVETNGGDVTITWNDGPTRIAQI